MDAAQADDGPTQTDAHPRVRVAEAVSRYGAAVVTEWCAGLLGGSIDYDDESWPSLIYVGGLHAAFELERGDLVRRGQDSWPRTWGARALLYVWTPSAGPAVVAGLQDPAWRVREMAAKVARTRELGEAADVLEALVGDETPRVRAAAIGALAVVGEAEHVDAVRDALHDEDRAVRRAAERALTELERRLDRRFGPDD